MDRSGYLARIEEAFRVAKVVALLGPRQSGKTTLARAFIRQTTLPHDAGLNYFDLEDPGHLARLEQPKLALEPLRGLVVIDEIQLNPELFPLLRVLVDREGIETRFLILGSASRDLIRQGAETLAGRIGFIEVAPFGLGEVTDVNRLWVRGGFPPAYLAESETDSHRWRSDYIKTFLERDIPALGLQIPAAVLRRFWMMLAHVHGQSFNASEIGKSLGVADTTAKRYLDILTGTFMLRRLNPWHENLKKRQVKTPKVYFRDSGLLHTLLGVADFAGLSVHPRLGASWEGFALEQVIRLAGVEDEQVYFWGVHNQGELDLLLFHKGKRWGFEIKYTDTPRRSASQKLALESLRLDRLDVVCPGDAHYPLGERQFVTGIESIAQQLAEG
jgi:predicted AAA+ superfamily ATPase